MSFRINFTATSAYSAEQKLREAYAPAAVKALIELSLAGVPFPRQAKAEISQARSSGTPVNTESEGPRGPRLVGVFVDAAGHLDDNGGRSWIDQFTVHPLYE